jgi:hypothetical protein
MRNDQLEAYQDPNFFNNLESFLQGDTEEVMPDVERKRENEWVKGEIGEIKYTQKEDISRKYSLDERIKLFQHLAALAPNLNDSCQEEGRTLYNLYQSIPEEERSKLCPQGYEDTDFSRIIDRIGEITPHNWPYENICMSGWEFKNRFIHENYPQGSSLFTTGLRSLAFLLNGLNRYSKGEERFETFFSYFTKDVDKLKDYRRDVIEGISSKLNICPTGDSNIQSTFSWLSFNRENMDVNIVGNIKDYLSEVIEKTPALIEFINKIKSVYVEDRHLDEVTDALISNVVQYPKHYSSDESLSGIKQQIDLVGSSVEFIERIKDKFPKHFTLDEIGDDFLSKVVDKYSRVSFDDVLDVEKKIEYVGTFVNFVKRINRDKMPYSRKLSDSFILKIVKDPSQISFEEVLDLQAKIELHNLGVVPNQYLIREYLSDPEKRESAAGWGESQLILENNGFNESNGFSINDSLKNYLVTSLKDTNKKQERVDEWKTIIDLFGEEETILTGYLLLDLEKAEDKETRVVEWKKIMDSFAKGNFDPDNELHRNLEYTRFRKIVDHEKVKKHVKNHFTFEDYLSIFEREITDELFTEKDLFEIECVAEEAELLRDYVLRVNEQAKEIGRELKVVPNLSYGYLPTSCLFTEFEKAGIESVIGVKVGSTECHSSREVINSRLFKGNRTKIANNQPIVVVVDGTYNLDPEKNRNSTIRYPDAHQGYLNQIIAINDALGFTDEDYSHVGKSTEDMERLRDNMDFKRTVEVYQHVLKDNGNKQSYNFQLWNTAEMDLAIRGGREVVDTVKPYDGNVDGPTMIFCNAGLLDEQISPELKSKYHGHTHNPAYYDDSGRIINFDFGHDNYGVRYLNRLESKLKEKYDLMNGNSPHTNNRLMPAIIKYLTKNKDTPQLDEAI